MGDYHGIYPSLGSAANITKHVGWTSRYEVKENQDIFFRDLDRYWVVQKQLKIFKQLNSLIFPNIKMVFTKILQENGRSKFTKSNEYITYVDFMWNEWQTDITLRYWQYCIGINLWWKWAYIESSSYS